MASSLIDHAGVADTYIDQYETIGYGNFTIAQIQDRIVGLEPDFDKALKLILKKLTGATEAMSTTLEKAGAMTVATYKPKKGDADPVAAARDVFRRLIKYAESRPGGDAIAKTILGGDTLSTVIRRRPSKLVAALNHALAGVTKHKSKLSEHKSWTEELTAARDALDALDKNVRKTRSDRRQMTPEVAAVRSEWLKIYGAAKLTVEAVLRLHDKVALMPEVFDDLADVQRVARTENEEEEAPAENTPS